ncbi:MAG: hypothetical protein A3J38_09440 [Gammaproteobacteria bacterium RIFCSPHIGHO2_12_FULL_45_9]|nr:MAG: hypothetical protein A3J38_09440 [Gammaproteobacteria bacterium RIFCSPHIGHO2_12_FULL_45_9]
MNRPFTSIALTARAHVPGVQDVLHALATTLLEWGCRVYLIEQSPAAQDLPIPLLPAHAMQASGIDVLIVVGGDGSLLHAARLAVDQHIPVLGINRGRLGFLTDIKPHALEAIQPILAGHYVSETRFLLEVQHPEITLNSTIALNDVVLSPGKLAQLIEFDIWINQQFVCHQRADGLIIATPTGSTAYALSAGGPILHPTLPALVLVPMFPHTLSSRPIVVESHSEIELRISPDQTAPSFSCDGHQRFSATPGSILRVRKKETPLTLIHPTDYNYYEVLREKLGWERRPVE